MYQAVDGKILTDYWYILYLTNFTTDSNYDKNWVNSIQKRVNMIDHSTITNIINRIAKNVNPDKIFLFGSYAKGQANEDSDIDLLVVKDTHEPKFKRSIEIQRLLIGSKIPVDIVVYTNDEFEEEKSKNFSFVNSIIQGAQLMYERK